MNLKIGDRVVHLLLKRKGIGTITNIHYVGTQFETISIRWSDTYIRSSYSICGYCPVKLYKKRSLKIKLP